MVSTSPAFLKGHNILGKHFAEIPYEPSQTVRIGNDVWIGEGVYIKSGVKIGDGAIIGAHAVVTHDVEPYSVVVGIPARKIRKRFDDDLIRRLSETEWWNWPDEKLEKFGETFSSPKVFLESVEAESKDVK
ncbi:MAG: CatB-related O-acetyltransferase [Clostridia bacterium]|nr:CatB-related O-acetyltransferase [Clostridia bacterium]